MAETNNNQYNTYNDKYYNEWASDQNSNQLFTNWLYYNYPKEAIKREAEMAPPAINYYPNAVRESLPPPYSSFEEYLKFRNSTSASSPVIESNDGFSQRLEAFLQSQSNGSQTTAPAPAPTEFQWQPLSVNNPSDFEFSPNLEIDPKFNAPAPTSILGMFPEVEAMQRALYQQKQNEAMQAQALQFARLDPFQKASYGLAMGGQQLGDAIGGALGAKDPQLQLISMRNAISRQIDMRDPESYFKAATLANQAGDTEFATSLVNVGNKLELDTSLIQQRTREKQAADPIQQLLRTGKFTAASVAEYEKSKNISDLREADSPNKIPAKIQEAQTVAKNKGFTEGTPEFNAEVVNYLERPEKETQVQQLQIYRKKLQDSKAPASDIAEVDAAIKALAEGSGTKIIMPGQPVAPKDWLAFTSQISKDPVMDRTSTVISDAPNAIETIRMSTTNDIAAASLPGSLARLTGEGKNMSDTDIARYARTGGLDNRVAQDVVGFFTGRKTTVTKEQAERFATAVYRGALLERKKFIQDQAEQAGYKDTPNYAIAIRQLDDQLAKFKLINPSVQTRESLPKATTEVDTEKEKRYQQYKKDQLGAKK
jgi:hypothetical protein